ncbi:tetratricopeptide repeat protein [Magnetovibrio blakemorei]|uniref:Uncharacterized protein n=1 Tax=Magnetovibrio blakemorei TaxID=28181 RepID=A0A1E5QBH8_9PROT|nr:tetratricopeptide repeat protein [Magnetovibrio blakemorei]OEJ68998.1 hypothetical protein BEN30_04570 [Magnetovibrio blakemorei]
MSYILEALKKSDAERKRGEIPTLGHASPFSPTLSAHAPNPVPWILAGALGLAVLILANVIYYRPDMLESANSENAPHSSPQPNAATAAPQRTLDVATPAPDPTPTPAQTPAPPPTLPPPLQDTVQEHVQESAVAEPLPLPEPQVSSITVHKPMPSPTPISAPAPAPIIESAPEPAPQAPTADPKPDTVQNQETGEAEVNTDGDAPQAETHVAAMPKPLPKPSLIVVPQAPIPPKPQAEVAKVFVEKAWSAIDKGFYNQALRDLDQAVKIEPNLAEAWFARGWANEKSGKELSAIGDYARAIAAKPDHAFALFSRGYLNLYIGDARHAVTDFVRAQGVAKDPSFRLYSHLWLYLSRTRAQQDGLAQLGKDAAKEDLTPWPGPLVRHVLGQIDEAALIAAMESDTGKADQHPSQQERRCTGYFFLGINALLNGDKASARRAFEKVLATGAVQFRQYDAAKRELDRLNL